VSTSVIPEYRALTGDDTQRCEVLRTIAENRKLQCNEPQAFFSNLTSPNPTVRDLAKKAVRALKAQYPGLSKALAHYRDHCNNAKQRKLLDESISEIDSDSAPESAATCQVAA
jgi:hypothetical protein